MALNLETTWLMSPSSGLAAMRPSNGIAFGPVAVSSHSSSWRAGVRGSSSSEGSEGPTESIYASESQRLVVPMVSECVQHQEGRVEFPANVLRACKKHSPPHALKQADQKIKQIQANHPSTNQPTNQPSKQATNQTKPSQTNMNKGNMSKTKSQNESTKEKANNK